jgi:hypothetical protein
MALFRKRPSGDAQDQIAVFWDWWTTSGRALAEQSIEGGISPDEFAAAMTARVHELGELAWELSSGEAARHVLVLTAEGDSARRGLARRAVLRAPEPDGTWSYTDTRPAAPDPETVVITVGERHVALSQVRVSARLDSGRFDVQLHHPSFAELPEDGRALVAFLSLDAALGEVDTEMWIGDVQPVELEPLDGFGLAALRSVVHDLKRQQLDADGRPRWAMLQGETPSGPLVAMVRVPLHPLTAPHLDTYVAVTLPYADRDDGGLPGPEALDALRWFEERLEAELGTHGQVVANLSNAGVRTLHLYVDSAADVVTTVKGLARSWDQGRASVHEMHDPGWSAVTHLRG